MIKYNGTPFQYNPAITNVNIDNQLAGILSQFSDDYIIDIVRDSLSNRFRIYGLPAPNIVAAYESNFKNLIDGFSSNTDDILETRKNAYQTIINMVCNYYNLTFVSNDDTDIYSAAFWIYEFLVSNFTDIMIRFYVTYLIRESASISNALNLYQLRKENDSTLAYSKRLFKNNDLALIHCNLEYVINQISVFDIKLWDIFTCVYPNDNVPNYLSSILQDNGNFFKDNYEEYTLNSRESADILTQIKLLLQQLGGEFEKA